jgi:hypothetical protein
VKLLSMMAQRGSTDDLSDLRIWPTRKGEAFSFARIHDVYVRDHPEARPFDMEVPMLYDLVKGAVVIEVRRLALRQKGSRTCSKNLQVRPLISAEQEQDNDGTRRLQLMAVAMSLVFPSVSFARPGVFDWLAQASMKRVDSLAVELTLEKITKIVPRACYRKPGNPVTFFRLGGHPDLYDELTSEIVRECKSRGLPEILSAPTTSGQADSPDGVRGDDVTWTVYRLLTRDPREWGRFVDGVPVSDEWIPPLMDADAEIKPGYLRVRSKLSEIYGYCQACGRRTPASEIPGETCEKVRSVVSLKGGRYKGEFSEYELQNSLFLCPSHFTLFERGLVRIPSIEDGEMSPGARAAAIRKLADEWPADVPGLDIQVFEGVVGDSQPSWKGMTMQLTPEHAQSMLRWLANWVEVATFAPG